MLVAIAIVGTLLALGLAITGRSPANKRRDATQQFAGLVEQARSAAITRRTTVLLAIAAPDAEHDATRLGLFETSSKTIAGVALDCRQIQRWIRLPDGIAFASGELAGLGNPLDAPPLDLRWQDGRKHATVHALAFSPRGGLTWPPGSTTVALSLGNGTLRIGRAVARPWAFDE